MPAIRKTDEFVRWLAELSDLRAVARIEAAIVKLELGNPGDVRPVGSGISEVRIHYGPGYRVYFVQRGKEMIVVLGGGDKSTQSRDIANAKALAEDL